MASEQSNPYQSARDAIVTQQVDPLAAPSYYPDFGSYYGGSPSGDNERGEGGLGGILQIARRRWWIVLGVAAVVTGVAWWRALQLVPQYSSQFLMLVNISRDRGRTGDIPVEGQAPISYSTLIQVLRSALVLNPVVTDLKEKYPRINQKILAGSLNIRLARDTDVLIVTYQSSNPNRVKAVLDRVGDAYLEYGETQARVDIQQGIDFVDGELPKLEDRVARLREQVKNFRQSYNIYNPDSRGGQLASEIANIEQQEDDLQIEITTAQATFDRLQEQLGYQDAQTASVVATRSEAVTSSPEVQTLEAEVEQKQSEIDRERLRFAEKSPMIQSLKQQLEQLEARLEESRAKALRGRPEEGAQTLQGIDRDFNRQLIETDILLGQLRIRESELASLKQQKENEFQNFPALSNEYLELQQELGRAEASLNTFLQAKEQYSLRASQESIPWQLITPASLPLKPISPDIPREMGLGVAAGLAMGVGLAFLVEKSDNVYHSPDSMRDTLPLPLLGIIPLYRSLRDSSPLRTPPVLTSGNGQHLLSGDSDSSQLNGSALPPPHKKRKKRSGYSLSPFMEAFRSLNANLNFLGTNRPIRAVTISSASPGDGKSTVSAYLAQAAAAMGQRVLLVDADLRRPQVHDIMGLRNHRGFSDAIGRDYPLRDAIQQSPSEKNLFVLTSGRVPPDPTRLLSSRKAHRIMEKLHSVFDVVIYDAPPLLGIADSTLLSKRTDGIVLIVSMDKTNRAAVNEAFTNLRMAGTTILGTVANRVRKQASSSGYYEYTSEYTPDDDDFSDFSDHVSDPRNDEIAAV